MRKAAELVSAEKAARRVVMLVNPGRKEWSAAAGLLYTGVQVMNPGEFTSAHRHQASALRFVMEGNGAYTVVDGERMTLGARDFVLTPNGTWHDHGVEADGTQCTWQDGLDIPLMNSLDANFYEVHPKIVQKPVAAVARELDEALLAGLSLQVGRELQERSSKRRRVTNTRTRSPAGRSCRPWARGSS